MSIKSLKKAPLAPATAGLVAGIAGAAQNKDVDELIAKIKDRSAEVRTKAWLGAGKVGAPAVEPLAKVMTDSDLEVARAAKRGLWKIVRHAGRPRARDEKRAVTAELIGLLGDDKPTAVRREVLWMLSEIGDSNSVKPIAALLSNKDRFSAFRHLPYLKPVNVDTIGYDSVWTASIPYGVIKTGHIPPINKPGNLSPENIKNRHAHLPADRNVIINPGLIRKGIRIVIMQHKISCKIIFRFIREKRMPYLNRRFGA